MQALRGVVFGVLGGVLLGACNGGSDGAVDPTPERLQRTPLNKLALQTFDADCADFLDYTADALTEQYLTPYFCAFDGPCPVFVDAGVPPPMATPAPGAGAGADGEAAGPDRVSGTNTQEDGVDEPDLLKADSDGRLYVLTGNELRIFAGYPVAGIGTTPITTLALNTSDGSFYPYELLLDDAGNRLIVLGGSYGGNSAKAVAMIIDVSAPAVPAVLRTIETDGSPLTVRRVGDRIHRVNRYDAPPPGWFYNDSELSALRDDYQRAQGNGDESAAAAARARIRSEIGERVGAAGADAFLPRQRIVETGGGSTTTALACNGISHAEVTTAMGLAVVDSFDTDGGATALSGIVNNSYLVYGSTANLYLVQSSLGWFFAPDQREESVIYRLALADDGPVAFRALGKIDGSVNNSYQLSEYKGALRVSSTERRQTEDANVSFNHVTVLDATSAGTMTRLGSVDENDLAPGETIQGTRFVGPRGYVVTFRQVDPLFAIDLSDPTDPVVTDELKIPGFSSYLMPLGDDTLLTIGRAGTDEGLSGGVAVQLFDVSDMSNIRQIAVATPNVDSGYSYSAAEYDARAFSYFADSESAALPGTLSIPLYSGGGFEGDRSTAFSGFLVLRVDRGAAEPLGELGRIDHGPLVEQDGECVPPPGGGVSDAAEPGCYFVQYSADPLRSVFVEDDAGRYLLTLSSAGVIASDAAQPGTILASRAWPDNDE